LGEMSGPDRLLERGLQGELLQIDPATGAASAAFTLQLSAPYGLTSVGQEIFAGNSSNRIDVYSRSGALLRTFNSAPSVFALGGASGTYGAQRVTLAGAQTLTGVDFGTTRAPVVGADGGYSTNEDTALSVSAPGVLANDSDPDGIPL